MVIFLFHILNRFNEEMLDKYEVFLVFIGLLEYSIYILILIYYHIHFCIFLHVLRKRLKKKKKKKCRTYDGLIEYQYNLIFLCDSKEIKKINYVDVGKHLPARIIDDWLSDAIEKQSGTIKIPQVGQYCISVIRNILEHSGIHSMELDPWLVQHLYNIFMMEIQQIYRVAEHKGIYIPKYMTVLQHPLFIQDKSNLSLREIEDIGILFYLFYHYGLFGEIPFNLTSKNPKLTPVFEFSQFLKKKALFETPGYKATPPSFKKETCVGPMCFFSIYWVIAVPRFCIYGQGITISRVGEYKSNYKFIDICPILKDEIIFDFVDVLICIIAVVSLMFLVMVPAFFVACFPLRYIWKLPI